MRSHYILAGIVLLAAQPCIHAAPQPANKHAKSAATFLRGAALPKWIAPLAALPPATRSEPMVIRLAETQAWTGPNAAVLVNRAIQVNDKTRLGEIGQYGLSYYPAYQKLRLHKVAIVRGGEVMDRTATVNTRLLEREPSLESGFYVGETTVQLLLDDVRVGDTLHIIYSTEGTNPVFGRLWADDFSWDYPVPIDHRRLTISHPAGQKIRWRELGDAAPRAISATTEQSGPVTRLPFEEKGLEAFEPDEGTPASFLPFHRIQTSEYASWQDVAVWARGLFAAPPPSPALAALARQFASGATEEERASAALRWVQDEIRYFSVSLGENSHRPQLPDAVLKRRFGDCKDKTALLIALLAQMGIKAEPVLVNAKAPQFPDKVLPSPTWFDHVIVRVHAGGKRYYVDPTRESERGLLSALPTAIPGAAGLVVAAGSTALLALPEEDGGFPWVETQEKFIVRELDEDAQLEVNAIFRGRYARYARMRYAAMSAADLRKDMLGDYDKQFRGATLVGAPTLKDSEDGQKFSVSARLNLPKPVSVNGEWHALPHRTRIMEGSLRIPDKLARSIPFEMPLGLYQARYRLQIVWPEQVKLVNAADAKTIDNPFFRAHKEYAWHGNEVDYVIDYAIKRKQLAPAELPELEAQSKLLNPWIESSLQFNGTSVVQRKARSTSVRNSAAATAVNQIQALAGAMGKNGGLATGISVDALCSGALASAYAREYYPGMPPASVWLPKEIGAAKGSDAEKERCKAQIAMQDRNFPQALAHFAKAGLAADGDALFLEQAWARQAGGDQAGAAADARSFVQARLKAGTLVPDDAALAMLLLQRGGQAPMPELDAYVRATPDAPWPRPVLDYLGGRLSQQELLRAAEQFGPSKREFALNDAWFYIAQRLRLEGRHGEAVQALRWFPAFGIPLHRAETLARLELAQLQSRDEDLLKGYAAENAKPPGLQAAKAHYLKAAARGVADAERELGRMAEYGLAGKADPQEAVQWYRRAAEHGDPDAMNSLGAAYTTGSGVERDQALALEWYQRAATPAHVHASLNLGSRYRLGRDGVAVDKKLALEHYKAAAQLGNADAQAVAGHMYFHGEGVDEDWPQALFWASRATAKGNADGTALLAFMLAYGHGIEQNLPKAIELWVKAAEDGSEAAQVQLGNAYQRGRGVERDPVKALAYFLKAGQQGNVHALLQVAIAIMNGDGVRADPARARTMLEALTATQVAEADYWLGRIAEKGQDGGKDLARAQFHYQRCAEAGDPDCQFKLAVFLELGKAGPADPRQAIAWYGKAAGQGDDGAMNNLADMHEKGRGTAVDLPLALELYRKAALEGNATALYSLGELNELGKGVPVNPYLAYVYYQLAAKGEPAGDAQAGSKRVAAQLTAQQLGSAQTVAKAWVRKQPLPEAAPAAGAAHSPASPLP